MDSGVTTVVEEVDDRTAIGVELEVLNRAMKLQSEIVEREKKQAAVAIRKQLIPARRELLEGLRTSIEGLVTVMESLYRFNERLDWQDVSSVGYPFKQPQWSLPQQMPDDTLEWLRQWLAEYAADGFLYS